MCLFFLLLFRSLGLDATFWSRMMVIMTDWLVFCFRGDEKTNTSADGECWACGALTVNESIHFWKGNRDLKISGGDGNGTDKRLDVESPPQVGGEWRMKKRKRTGKEAYLQWRSNTVENMAEDYYSVTVWKHQDNLCHPAEHCGKPTPATWAKATHRAYGCLAHVRSNVSQSAHGRWNEVLIPASQHAKVLAAGWMRLSGGKRQAWHRRVPWEAQRSAKFIYEFSNILLFKFSSARTKKNHI